MITEGQSLSSRDKMGTIHIVRNMDGVVIKYFEFRPLFLISILMDHQSSWLSFGRVSGTFAILLLGCVKI